MLHHTFMTNTRDHTDIMTTNAWDIEGSRIDHLNTWKVFLWKSAIIKVEVLGQNLYFLSIIFIFNFFEI